MNLSPSLDPKRSGQVQYRRAAPGGLVPRRRSRISVKVKIAMKPALKQVNLLALVHTMATSAY